MDNDTPPAAKKVNVKIQPFMICMNIEPYT